MAIQANPGRGSWSYGKFEGHDSLQSFQVLLGIIKQAVRSDRTTLVNEFIQQGHSDVADILRRL